MEVKMTKKDITEKIGKLRKYGYLVYPFQNNRKSRTRLAGIMDYLVVGNGVVVFIEAKLISTKDKLSEKQIEFKEKVEEAKGLNLAYVIVDEKNIDRVVDSLISLAELNQIGDIPVE